MSPMPQIFLLYNWELFFSVFFKLITVNILALKNTIYSPVETSSYIQ